MANKTFSARFPHLAAKYCSTVDVMDMRFPAEITDREIRLAANKKKIPHCVLETPSRSGFIYIFERRHIPLIHHLITSKNFVKTYETVHVNELGAKLEYQKVEKAKKVEIAKKKIEEQKKVISNLTLGEPAPPIRIEPVEKVVSVETSSLSIPVQIQALVMKMRPDQREALKNFLKTMV